MLTKFDYTYYDSKSIVKVILGDYIRSDEEFDNFTDEWSEINKKRNYILIIDTSNVESINIKYVYKLAQFIKSLKECDFKHLQLTIIMIKNSFVNRLLDMLLYIQSPIATVYIINDFKYIDDIFNNKNSDNLLNNPNIKVHLPY